MLIDIIILLNKSSETIDHYNDNNYFYENFTGISKNSNQAQFKIIFFMHKLKNILITQY